jgi:hypothetical protein
MQFVFSAEGRTWPIRLNGDAPRTIWVAGCIGAWFDLLTPWNDLNEVFRKARG